MKGWSRHEMCSTAAHLEINRDGMYINLGIGIPTEVANYVHRYISVIFHSENGMLGIGEFPHEGDEDPDLINAGKQTITELPGASYFSSDESFAMARGGHLDLTILGGMQVSKDGDLANWMIPGKKMTGVGGAMDLVANTKRVVVIMEHNAKNGSPKFLDKCTFPLTGIAVVHRLITNLGVFDITGSGVVLILKPHDVTVEEIQSKTECKFDVCLQSVPLVIGR